jgi:hypothetical protein
MFRFMLRSDAVCFCFHLQIFDSCILCPFLFSKSMIAVTIIRYFELVQEASRDSFTLCALTLVQTSALVPISHFEGTKSSYSLRTASHKSPMDFSCHQ